MADLSQPNLQLRFHQLWAVLFQSPMTAAHEVPPQGTEAIPSRILGAISLFIPQPVVSSRFEATMMTQEMRIALEKSIQPSQKSDDMTVTRLVKSITEVHVPIYTLYRR